MKRRERLSACILVALLCVSAIVPAVARAASMTVHVAANKTSAAVGTPITWVVTSAGGSGALAYRFDIYCGSTRVGGTDAYGASYSFTYTPTAVGSYLACGWVKDGNGEVASEFGGIVEVTGGALSMTIAPSVTSATTGQSIKWTINASGGTGAKRYYFDVYRGSTRVGGTGTYTSANSFSLAANVAGTYVARGYVKDATGAKVTVKSARTIVKPDSVVSVTSVTASAARVTPGANVKWTINATGGVGTKTYYFMVYRDGTLVKSSAAYAASNTLTYTPTVEGYYTVRGFAKDAGGQKANRLSAKLPVADKIVMGGVNCGASNVGINTPVTWSASATGGYGNLTYYFTIYKGSTVVKRSSAYGSAKTFTYTPATAGAYYARVYAKDASAQKVYADSAALTVVADPVTRRALAVGTGLYEKVQFEQYTYNERKIFAYDAAQFARALKNSTFGGSGFQISTLTNPGNGTIALNSIANYFKDADANDVSYLYLFCHGGKPSSSEYRIYIGTGASGSQYITSKQLRTTLDKVKGTVVVIFGCCYSGDTLNMDAASGQRIDADGAATMQGFSPSEFIESFLSTSNGTLSGELVASKYKVICGSKRTQVNRFTVYLIQQIGYCWTGGAIGMGIGWNYAQVNPSACVWNADANGDGKVTMNELYAYITPIIKKWDEEKIGSYEGSPMQVCMYPSSSSFVLFQK